MVDLCLILITVFTALILVALTFKVDEKVYVAKETVDQYRVFTINRFLKKIQPCEKKILQVEDSASAVFLWITLLLLFALIATVLHYGA